MEVRSLKSLFTLIVLSQTLISCAESEQAGSFRENVSLSCKGAKIEGQYIVNWKDGEQTVEAATDDREFKEQFLADKQDEIVFAEPDYMISSQEFILKNSQTESTEPTGFSTNWGISAIKANEVWNQGYYGQGVTVAVIDSGTEPHVQLNNVFYRNMAEINGKAGVDDDGNGLVDDVMGWNFADNVNYNIDESGHGTHVAGIVAAEHSAGPILGVAPQAKILPIDFMRASGGRTSDAIAALKYAAQMGAKVVNASWGSFSCSQSLKETFSQLENSHNILFVIAAGNSGRDLNFSPEYPAAFDLLKQITVGALDTTGFRASFSNYGSLVDLLAPGSQIESTVPGGYAYSSGTSMAAPFVAGQAALLWSKKPTATAKEVKDAIMNTLDLYAHNVQPRGKARADKSADAL